MEAALATIPSQEAPVTAVPAAPARTMWWVLLAGLVILFGRKTDSFVNPQFWAEDGPVYFMTARIEGIRSILRPYEANCYVIHRLIAYVGSLVPVRYAPHFYAFVCLVVTLGVMAYICQARIDARYRGWMALALVCVPHTGEVFLVLDNIHWLLALLMLVLALSADPQTFSSKIWEAIVLFFMVLDGPFVLLYAPLFALRAWRLRSSYAFVLVGVAIFGALWQLGLLRFLVPIHGTLTLHYKHTLYPGEMSVSDPAWRAFWGNCISGILLLGRPLTEAYPNNGPMVVLTLAFYGGLAFYGLRYGGWLYFGFFWGIVSILGALAYVYRAQPFYATISPGFRYSYIPYVCTVWLLLWIVQQRGQAGRLALAFLALIAVSSLTLFHFPALEDKHWAEMSRGIGGPIPCIVPINGVPSWRIYYDPEIEAGRRTRAAAAPAAETDTR